jgi:hypothetical protein
MASNQVATTLTIAYWIASIPFGASLVRYSAPWIWIGWVLAVLFFVIPLAAILWFIALLDRFAKLDVSRQHFALVGTVVPALYAWCVMGRST